MSSDEKTFQDPGNSISRVSTQHDYNHWGKFLSCYWGRNLLFDYCTNSLSRLFARIAFFQSNGSKGITQPLSNYRLWIQHITIWYRNINDVDIFGNNVHHEMWQIYLLIQVLQIHLVNSLLYSQVTGSTLLIAKS